MLKCSRLSTSGWCADWACQQLLKCSMLLCCFPPSGDVLVSLLATAGVLHGFPTLVEVPCTVAFHFRVMCQNFILRNRNYNVWAWQLLVEVLKAVVGISSEMTLGLPATAEVLKLFLTSQLLLMCSIRGVYFELLCTLWFWTIFSTMNGWLGLPATAEVLHAVEGLPTSGWCV